MVPSTRQLEIRLPGFFVCGTGANQCTGFGGGIYFNGTRLALLLGLLLSSNVTSPRSAGRSHW